MRAARSPGVVATTSSPAVSPTSAMNGSTGDGAEGELWGFPSAVHDGGSMYTNVKMGIQARSTKCQ